MTSRLWKAPEMVRGGATLLAIFAVALLARLGGWPLSWSIAVQYGLALGVAARWPVVAPRSGVRIYFLGGLILEAFWHHGPLTAVMVVLIDYGVRLITLYRRQLWAWQRPALVIVSVFLSYGLALLLTGTQPTQAHWLFPHMDEASILMAWAFWLLLIGLGLAMPRRQALYTRRAQFFFGIRQTWWVPLLLLSVQWLMEIGHSAAYDLTLAFCLILLWLYYNVGSIFNGLLQEQAVTDLLRLSPPPTSLGQERAYQVLNDATLLAHRMKLSPPEMRRVGYAAVLQECLPTAGADVPLWLVAEPEVGVLETIRGHLDAVVRHIEQDAALVGVADLVHLRYANYDGSGYPARAGVDLPLAAQVLAAANALVTLRESGIAADNAEAVAWLRAHAAERFSPEVMAALMVEPPSPNVDLQGLPEMVRQLQGLLRGRGRPNTVAAGLRALWAHMRGQIGLAQDLPVEIQAVGRLATFFASSTNMEQTAEITVTAVGQLLRGKVTLALREGDDSKLALRIHARYGFTQVNPVGAEIVVISPLVRRAIMEQKAEQFDDIRAFTGNLAREVALTEEVRSCLLVPLVARGRTTGLLMIGLPQHHWFTPREVALVNLMAGQAAVALENCRLMAEVEERLHNTEELKNFADTLLDNLQTAILVIDQEGRLVSLNASARMRFGEVDGLAPGSPLPVELAQALRTDLALADEQVPERDVEWAGAVLEMQAIPLHDQRGITLGAICMARDVTTVRSMEEQVQRVERLAAVGQLAAGAAHEIRNPLTSIRGFIQLIQARVASAPGEYFQIIINEIDRIDEIIRDLLILARPVSAERVETKLEAILDEVLLLHKSQLERQMVQVTSDVYPTVSKIAIDPKMFRQLLHNLITNAIQAMPYGGILSLLARPAGNGEVVLQIGDTGVGIAPENQKRLFMPFFTTKEEGTGLGLALCYSIVQAHGGRIDVESREGLGTTFTITLPLH
ncbi:MAG: ATP-binding protein [Mycobacterium leprae]